MDFGASGGENLLEEQVISGRIESDRLARERRGKVVRETEISNEATRRNPASFH